jgi:hypothetical protein
VELLYLLTLIFVVLKLMAIISWNWFLVFLPILLPAIIVIGYMTCLVGAALLVMAVDTIIHLTRHKSRNYYGRKFR